METQSQAAAADYRPPSDMVHHVQQLQQSGFNDGQVRALASFVGDVVRDTMRPFIKHVDQRFDDMQMRVDQRFDDMQMRVDQRFEAVNERFDAMDQRFGDMNRRVERVETRLGRVEAHVEDAKERLGHVEARLENVEKNAGRVGENVAELRGETKGVRHMEWIAIAVLVLGFVSIVTAIFLAARIIG